MKDEKDRINRSLHLKDNTRIYFHLLLYRVYDQKEEQDELKILMKLHFHLKLKKRLKDWNGLGNPKKVFICTKEIGVGRGRLEGCYGPISIDIFWI